MKILVSNDDGYQAPGIVALYEALKDLAEVEVVAPEINNSAKSNALTLHGPLYVTRASNGFRYINGTPADCVHIALTGLLGYRPDLVVSGINNGANMGDDTIYSGTVGAAMEGYLFGVPAIAFSQVEKGWTHIDAAAAKARELVQQMLAQQLVGANPWLLNVNIPNLPLGDIKPMKICRLGKRHAAETVITQQSPRGETMYWIGGAGAVKDDAEGTDFHATVQGHISMTPLKTDLTDHEYLKYWGQTVASINRGAQSANPVKLRPPFPARLEGSDSRKPSGRGGATVGVTPHARRLAVAAEPDAKPAPQKPAGAASQAPGFVAVRDKMVRLLANQGVSDAQVLDAMRTVERHRFVDSALQGQAYEDTSLPIGLGQTISKPGVVSRMIELLRNGRQGKLGRVLEIGTGCGYQAAVLSLLAQEVYTIERLRGLHDKARDNLRHLRLPNLHLLFGDGMVGFAKGAPYAGIIAAAGGDALPAAWTEQLAVGGRLVAPVSGAAGKPGQQALLVVEKTAQGLRQSVFEAVHFVPLKSGVA